MKKITLLYPAIALLAGCASQVTEGPVSPNYGHTPCGDGLQVKKSYVLEPQPEPIKTKSVQQGESSLKHNTPDQPLFVR